MNSQLSLHPPSPVAVESCSSILTDDSDDLSDDKIGNLGRHRLFHEFVVRRKRALLPHGSKQHDLMESLRKSHFIQKVADNVQRRHDELVDEIIDGGYDATAPEAQHIYQAVVGNLEYPHVQMGDDSDSDQYLRALRKCVNAQLRQKQYRAACLTQLKISASQGCAATPTRSAPSQRWIDCVRDVSRQLEDLNRKINRSLGSNSQSRSPAPPLHLLLTLGLNDKVFQTMVVKEPSLTEDLDLTSRNVLHIAAEFANSKAINFMAEKLPHLIPRLINERDLVGRPPILVAAYLGNLSCFKLLEAAGARLNVLEIDLRGGLELACAAGNLKIVEYLLEHPDPSKRCLPNGRTGSHAPNPLHNASRSGVWAVCKLLLDKGAKSDVTDLTTGRCAAVLAYEKGHHEVCMELINSDPTHFSEKQFLQHRAALANHTEVDTQLAQHPSI